MTTITTTPSNVVPADYGASHVIIPLTDWLKNDNLTDRGFELGKKHIYKMFGINEDNERGFYIKFVSKCRTLLNTSVDQNKLFNLMSDNTHIKSPPSPPSTGAQSPPTTTQSSPQSNDNLKIFRLNDLNTNLMYKVMKFFSLSEALIWTKINKYYYNTLCRAQHTPHGILTHTRIGDTLCDTLRNTEATTSLMGGCGEIYCTKLNKINSDVSTSIWFRSLFIRASIISFGECDYMKNIPFAEVFAKNAALKKFKFGLGSSLGHLKEFLQCVPPRYTMKPKSLDTITIQSVDLSNNNKYDISKFSIHKWLERLEPITINRLEIDTNRCLKLFDIQECESVFSVFQTLLVTNKSHFTFDSVDGIDNEDDDVVIVDDNNNNNLTPSKRISARQLKFKELIIEFYCCRHHLRTDWKNVNLFLSTSLNLGLFCSLETIIFNFKDSISLRGADIIVGTNGLRDKFKYICNMLLIGNDVNLKYLHIKVAYKETFIDYLLQYLLKQGKKMKHLKLIQIDLYLISDKTKYNNRRTYSMNWESKEAMKSAKKNIIEWIKVSSVAANELTLFLENYKMNR